MAELPVEWHYGPGSKVNPCATPGATSRTCCACATTRCGVSTPDNQVPPRAPRIPRAGRDTARSRGLSIGHRFARLCRFYISWRRIGGGPESIVQPCASCWRARTEFGMTRSSGPATLLASAPTHRATHRQQFDQARDLLEQARGLAVEMCEAVSAHGDLTSPATPRMRSRSTLRPASPWLW